MVFGMRGILYNRVVNVWDSNSEVSEFEFQLHH